MHVIHTWIYDVNGRPFRSCDLEGWAVRIVNQGSERGQLRMLNMNGHSREEALCDRQKHPLLHVRGYGYNIICDGHSGFAYLRGLPTAVRGGGIEPPRQAPAGWPVANDARPPRSEPHGGYFPEELTEMPPRIAITQQPQAQHLPAMDFVPSTSQPVGAPYAPHAYPPQPHASGLAYPPQAYHQGYFPTADVAATSTAYVSRQPQGGDSRMHRR